MLRFRETCVTEEYRYPFLRNGNTQPRSQRMPEDTEVALIELWIARNLWLERQATDFERNCFYALCVPIKLVNQCLQFSQIDFFRIDPLCSEGECKRVGQRLRKSDGCRQFTLQVFDYRDKLSVRQYSSVSGKRDRSLYVVESLVDKRYQLTELIVLR